ncbi:MAG: HAMP domain-containing protein [Cyanobacteria bacterium P01_F01_bin.53]
MAEAVPQTSSSQSSSVSRASTVEGMTQSATQVDVAPQRSLQAPFTSSVSVDDIAGNGTAAKRAKGMGIRRSQRLRGGSANSGSSEGIGRGTSLRLRLLQTVLPVVLIPLFLAGLAGYRLVQQRTGDRVQRQLANQALLTSEGTNAVLEELLTVPRTIAASPLVINEAIAGAQQVREENLDDMPIAELESQFSATKLLRVHNRLNSYLQETAKTAGVSEISIAESHGYNVAYSQPTTDFVQSDEAWWQKGQEDGQWIGSPDFSYAAKGFTVELAQAIKEPTTGNVIGVVRTVSPTRKFSLLAQYIKRTGISGSQRVQLIDGRKLKVIDTLTAQGFVKKRDIIGDEPIKQAITAFVTSTQVDESATKTLEKMKRESDVKNLSVAFSDDDITVASFTHRDRQYKLASIPNTAWVSIASMKTSEISALGSSPLWFLTLTTLILAGVTGAVILWLSRQLTAPLDSLAAQARQVSAGDFDTLVTPSGTAETRMLTESFNQLVVKTRGLLDHQRNETQKAQIFSAVTAAPANTLLDLRAIFEDVLPEAKRMLQANRVFFYPVTPEFSVLLASESVNPGFPSTLPASAACVPLSLFSDRSKTSAEAINDVSTATLDAGHQDYLRELGVGSTLSAPVFSDGDIFGFLIAHRSAPSQWSSSQVDFMTQLAAQLKLVIDRVSSLQKVKESRRIEQESRQVAQESRQMAEVLTVEKQQLSSNQQRQQAQLQAQVSALVNDIQGVSQGDLTVRARAADGELQTVVDGFNQTVARLQTLVNQVQQSTVQVNTFLSQNEAAAAQLSQTTGLQTQEAKRTLASVQEMTGAMDGIAQNAQSAAATAQTVSTTVQDSENAMELTAARIEQLRRVSTAAVKQIEGLGRSGQHIGQVSTMIRELANEISMLSHQTRSETQGAEANQQLSSLSGRIEQLAHRTLEETTLIDRFVTALEQRAGQIASSLEQINGQVSQSTQLVQESKQSFGEVAVVAKEFDQLAQSISQATQTQTQNSQAVTNLVQAVVGLSDQTATFSQEMERALSETLKTAQELQGSVSQFRS